MRKGQLFNPLILMLCALMTLLSGCAATSTKQVPLLTQAEATLDSFKVYPELTPFFEQSYGYAIFPSVGKGAFWVGGAYGKGIVYRKHVAVSQAELKQISVGFAFGGQAFSEILFFENARTFEDFLSGTFALNAQVSAAALTEGAAASAGTQGVTTGSSRHEFKARYVNGTAVFTQNKGGLMIEAAVAGQHFEISKL
ncbi:lipid-binding SYLF domain-containing protein [Veronia pacifica]|uniref:Ysc84 actin-binding domain-containing protein n=1 Tax=Veronia pacifica TaxID=1080227 RepID=A0A1C3EF72_9GAMM|nr:lipid-binding SYLF domain-containing protein [Veronia pacifica]ODA31869.1 hypothetical protein A8L45_14765 [Veronia pacifica]